MTFTPDDLIFRIACRQDSTFTRSQALEAGFTRRQIDGRIASRRWLRPDRNVYLLPGVPPGARQQLRIAVLASGGAASHRSAACMHGLITGHPPKPEITVSPNRNYGTKGVVVRRQRDVTEANITEIAGLRCTDAYETLLSLGIAVPEALLERALDRSLHRGLIDYDRLVSYYFRKAKQGRDGGGRLRELFCIRDPEMPPGESDLETVLLRVLRGSGLPMPERQVPLTLGRRDVRFDLAYSHLRICLEGDGFGTHTTRGAFETDRSRHNAVVLAGWLPLHFTWRMIVHDPAYVVATIHDALQNRGSLGV